jgi:hypothetical protein
MKWRSDNTGNLYQDGNEWKLRFSRGEMKTVVSRQHFFSVAPSRSHVPGTTTAGLGDLRGFGGERR